MSKVTVSFCELRRKGGVANPRNLGYVVVVVVGAFMCGSVVWYQRGETGDEWCKLCNFVPFGPVNSSRRDAVFAAVTEYGRGVEILVRSLRTTGCRASVVLFTTDESLVPLELKACDVKVVVVEPFGKRAASSPYKIRWEWYYVYLKEHVNEYDRVFHTDAFDAFFLSDPFEFAPDRGALYFQMEDKPLRWCPYNKKWLLSCHHDCNRWKLLSKTIACSGSLVGGAAEFLSFIEMMVTHNEWPSCWGKGFDQGDFNYILYTQYEPNHNAIFMNCNSGFLTVNYCGEAGLVFDTEEYLLTPDRTKRVAYVHQYNRASDVATKLTSLCPSNLPNT